MGGLEARVVLRGFAAITIGLAIIWLALWYFIPAPPHEITMAVGVKDGPFEHLALRYRERLARHHVKLNIRFTKSSADSIKLLRDSKSGLDAVFSLGGVTNSSESPGLVSLGRIAYSPIWILYRGPETIDNLSQLRGKRLSLGPSTAPTYAKILAAYGVNAENTTLLTHSAPAAKKMLRDGIVDVIFISQQVTNPNILGVLRDPSFRLVNVAQAEALAQLFPSLSRLALSQGVIDLQKNIPASDINLISLTDVVLVRADLHPEMIYLLARTMKQEHGHAGIFQRVGEFPTQTDPEFPMAEEAIDYYKNGPSFLQRYLPFWMINYAKRVAAILIAAVAVVIPIFTYGPKVYRLLLNARLMKLYRRLRDIEAELEGQLTAAQVEVAQVKLEGINRAARILTTRHSDLFINLMGHIRLIRVELALRLAATRD